MSEQNHAPDEQIPTDWRERMRAGGKEAFQLEEMRRLGFWPPEQVEVTVAEAEVRVKEFDRELAPLKQRLRNLEATIAKAQDVESALDEIRRKRIERVKQERVERKARQVQEKAARAEVWQAKRAVEPQFLGHGVSQGLEFGSTDREKLTALGLPVLESVLDISGAIGIWPRELTWLTYHRGASMVDHYHRFQIPKKKGGMRNVSSPKKRLRVAQNWLHETILKPLPVHPAATAFKSGASVVDNAARHHGKSIVVRIDLKDFFPSIGFVRVKRLFQSFGYNQGVSTVFALLATEAPRLEMTLDGQKRHVAIGERVLPQGACTSPAITNLLCRRLDARLTGLAQQRGFNYSRYADDLVFSTDDATADMKTLIALVRKVVADEKFVVNDEKTSVMRTNARQVVTGLVVNNQDATGPRVSRNDLRRFRAFLHRYETVGREKLTEELGRDALAHARGMVAWIGLSEPEKTAKFKAKYPWL